MLELNQLYNMDCMEGMKAFPNKYFDLAIVDPPYFQIKGSFDFIWKSFDEYMFWTENIINEIGRLLSDRGSLYLWGMLGLNDKTYTIIEQARIINKSFEFRNFITWEREASRHPPKNWAMCNEHLLYFTKSDDYVFNRVASLDKRPSNGGYQMRSIRKRGVHKYATNVWSDLARVGALSKEYTLHPTQKPINVCTRIIEASSNKGEKILIPFGGSGSECLAAISAERDWVAFEIDKDYYEAASKRIENHKMQLKLF